LFEEFEQRYVNSNLAIRRKLGQSFFQSIKVLSKTAVDKKFSAQILKTPSKRSEPSQLYFFLIQKHRNGWEP